MQKKGIKLVASLIALWGLLSMGKPAQAGPYADELGRCLSRSATSADKTILAKWIFSIMSLSPDLREISSLTDSQRTQLNQQMAQVFMSLVSRSCRTQAKNALKYEGTEGFGQGFGTLGEMAMILLYTNPAVSEGMLGFIEYIDLNKLSNLLD